MERLDPPESKLDLDKYLWMFSTFGYLYSFDCTQGCTWDTVFGIWYSVLSM